MATPLITLPGSNTVVPLATTAPYPAAKPPLKAATNNAEGFFLNPIQQQRLLSPLEACDAQWNATLQLMPKLEFHLPTELSPQQLLDQFKAIDAAKLVGPPWPPPKPREFIMTDKTPTTYGPNKLPFPVLDKEAAEKFVVLLDAGHGGRDEGNISTLDGKKIFEKDLAVTVSNKVWSILKKAGVENAYLTRYMDPDWDQGEYKDVVQARRGIIEKSNPDLMLSIHFNARGNRLARGQEYYYCMGSSRDMTAHFTQNALEAGYGASGPMQQGFYPVNVDPTESRRVKGSDVNVTMKVSTPEKFIGATLVEGGYMTNATELKKLVDENYQDEFAATLAAGIITALNKKAQSSP